MIIPRTLGAPVRRVPRRPLELTSSVRPFLLDIHPYAPKHARARGCQLISNHSEPPQLLDVKLLSAWWLPAYARPEMAVLSPESGTSSTWSAGHRKIRDLSSNGCHLVAQQLGVQASG